MKTNATTYFSLEVNPYASGGPKQMVHAVRVRNNCVVAQGWFEPHRLDAHSPTGVSVVISILRDKELMVTE